MPPLKLSLGLVDGDLEGHNAGLEDAAAVVWGKVFFLSKEGERRLNKGDVESGVESDSHEFTYLAATC